MSNDPGSRRWEYLAEGNAKQARKRVAAKVVVRDRAGRVLVVNPSYKEHWDLPGGMVEANEPPRAGAERELREELGVTITADRLLDVDWVGPHGPWDDQLVFIFDGGIMTAEQVTNLRVTDSELTSFAFLPPDEAAERLRSDIAERLQRAITALELATTCYVEHDGG